MLWWKFFKLFTTFFNISNHFIFCSTHHQFQSILNHLTTGCWCRRFDCLNTHHFEFGFFISHTFTIPDIENVSFFSSPNSTISNILTFHLHLLIISIYIVGQFLVATFNILLKFHLTDLIKERDNALSSFLSSFVYIFNQRTQVEVNTISVRSNNIINSICLKNFV